MSTDRDEERQKRVEAAEAIIRPALAGIADTPPPVILAAINAICHYALEHRAVPFLHRVMGEFLEAAVAVDGEKQVSGALTIAYDADDTHEQRVRKHAEGLAAIAEIYLKAAGRQVTLDAFLTAYVNVGEQLAGPTTTVEALRWAAGNIERRRRGGSAVDLAQQAPAGRA